MGEVSEADLFKSEDLHRDEPTICSSHSSAGFAESYDFN